MAKPYGADEGVVPFNVAEDHRMNTVLRDWNILVAQLPTWFEIAVPYSCIDPREV